MEPCGETLRAVVCDGLGGHRDGARAARTAAGAALEHMTGSNPNADALRAAATAANGAVNSCAGDSGMRSTIAALWAEDGRALVATVGDTRVYQLRGGCVQWQSLDHSLAQYDVVVGDATPEQIRGNARRNQLTRALGADEDVKPDVTELAVEQGDVFVLCTDGCWEPVPESDLVAALGEHGAEGLAGWLERVVDERSGGAGDNHTAVVVEACADEQAGGAL